MERLQPTCSRLPAQWKPSHMRAVTGHFNANRSAETGASTLFLRSPGLADAMLWHREKRVSEDGHRAADFPVYIFDSVFPFHEIL